MSPHRPPHALTVLVFALVTAGCVLGFSFGNAASRHSAFTVGPGVVYARASGGSAWLGIARGDHALPSERYEFTEPVTWISESGAVHNHSAAPCLSVDHFVQVKQLETVKYPLPGGGSENHVVWVRC